MIPTSNSDTPVEATAPETQSPVETPNTETPAAEAPAENLSMRETMEKAAKEKPAAAAAPGDKPAVIPAANAPKPWEPNFKYKAYGKEREIPEKYRAFVKDADSETLMKDVFTRADAFDDMKASKENVSAEFQRVSTQYNDLDRDVKRIMGFRNSGDFDNFFAALKISDQDIYAWAEQKILASKDPAALQRYQQAAQMRAEALHQKESNTTLQQERDQHQAQVLSMQLDLTLSRSDIASVASAWDTRAGEVGAFRNLVIQEASNAYIHSQGKQILTPEQAVNAVMKKFGKFVETTPQAPSNVPTPAAPAAPQAPAPVAPAAKPVIPNVQGKGASPIKQAPKSLDDLRKLGKEARRVQEIPNL